MYCSEDRSCTQQNVLGSDVKLSNFTASLSNGNQAQIRDIPETSSLQGPVGALLAWQLCLLPAHTGSVPTNVICCWVPHPGQTNTSQMDKAVRTTAGRQQRSTLMSVYCITLSHHQPLRSMHLRMCTCIQLERLPLQLHECSMIAARGNLLHLTLSASACL